MMLYPHYALWTRKSDEKMTIAYQVPDTTSHIMYMTSGSQRTLHPCGPCTTLSEDLKSEPLSPKHSGNKTKILNDIHTASFLVLLQFNDNIIMIEKFISRKTY